MNVFRSFFAFILEMHVRCNNQYKNGADGGTILGQPMLFVCMGIYILSAAHESLSADCKILISLILFKFSHIMVDWTALSWVFWGHFSKTFLEGSVDRVIYSDYAVNRLSFIFTVAWPQV